MYYNFFLKTTQARLFFFVYGLDPAMGSQFATPALAKLYCKVEGQNCSELTCARHYQFQNLASGWGLHMCVFVAVSDPSSLIPNFSLSPLFLETEILGVL